MNIKAKGLFCNCGKPMFAKGLCKPCYGLFWRENNREHNLQLQADWRAAHPNYGSESYHANKEKRQQQTREWRKVNKKRTRITNRLLRTGVTENQFQDALKKQAGLCAICDRRLGNSPDTDHCHTTGVFRGLLCGKCNPALGLFNDDVNLLDKAKSYLLKFK
jgi:hypothetical protein